MDIRFIGKMLINFLLMFACFLSCKSNNKFLGKWESTDSNLYIGTEIKFTDENEIIITNLPQYSFVSIDDNLEMGFDTDIKECKFDKKDNRIWYENYSKQVFADIVFFSSTEMDVLFHNGTYCHFEKANGE